MIFPAISSAPWWEILLAKLFGKKYLAYDPELDPTSPLRMEITTYEWRHRIYAVSYRKVCRESVCKLKCMQTHGGCQADAESNRSRTSIRS
jgi:hypothetical protein